MRPIMVTLIGYLVIPDAFINSIGWGLDLMANHSPSIAFFTAWGNYADNGYFLGIQLTVHRRHVGAR